MPRTVTSLKPLMVTVTGTVTVPLTRYGAHIRYHPQILRRDSLDLLTQPPQPHRQSAVGRNGASPDGSLSNSMLVAVRLFSSMPSSVISAVATSLPFTSHVPSGGVTT